MAVGSWTAGRMFAPKPQLVFYADECPEQDSPSWEPGRGLCPWGRMAVTSPGGPAELPTAVLSDTPPPAAGNVG